MAKNKLPSKQTPITAKDIQNINIDAPTKPSSLALKEQRALFDHQQKMKNQEIGWVGKIIGDKNEKPGNIAFLIIIGCFIAIVVMYCISIKSQESMAAVKDILGFFTNLIALTLGYLYGQKDK